MLQNTQKASVLALATLAAPLLIGGCGDTGEENTGTLPGGTNVGTSGTATGTPTKAAAAGVAGVNSMAVTCGLPGCANCETVSQPWNMCDIPKDGYLVASGNGAVYEASAYSGPQGTGFAYVISSGTECAANIPVAECGLDDTDPCLVPFCAECTSDGSACNQCEAGFSKGLAPGPDGIGTYQYCLPDDSSDCPTNARPWDSVGYLAHNLCAEVECLIPGCDKCSIANQCDNCSNGELPQLKEGPDGKTYRFCVDPGYDQIETAGGSGMRGDCTYDAWDSATIMPHFHTPYHNHNPLC